MTRPALLLLLAILPCLVLAEDRPRWAFELKGGQFRSALADWAEYYGNDRLPQVEVGVGYSPWRMIEFGVEAGALRDRGHGLAPSHGATAGEVTYWLFPVHLSLTLRGVVREGQWLVPYAGASVGRYAYRIDTRGQERVSGATDGHRYRAGMQLLLDRLDPRSAWDLHRTSGITHTYLFIEYQNAEARLDGTDLGGESWLGGMRVEF